MTSEMKNYEKMIQQKLERQKSRADLMRLAEFHARRIAEFQYERLIHLLVTMFFAGLLFAAAGLFFAVTVFEPSLAAPTGALVLILFVLELFYIRHYYYLENGTQRLYRLTTVIAERIEAAK